MEVEVEDALARLFTDVGNHPVTLQPQLLRELGDDLENMGHYAAVVRRDLGDGANVGFGDHQEVGGSLRSDVVEGIAQIVLVDLIAGDFPGGNVAK